MANSSSLVDRTQRAHPELDPFKDRDAFLAAMNEIQAQDAKSYADSKNRWGIADKIATGVAGGLLTGGIGSAFAGPAASGSTAGSTAAAGGLHMTGSTGLGIAQLLANVFGNIWGTNKQIDASTKATDATLAAQNKAAELNKQAIDEALAYQKSIDERDYKDWLAREARDRTDWENEQQRRAPYRALGDSAIRTLADYIRVPGMQPAQPVPVQHWTAPTDPRQVMPPSGVSNTMPIDPNAPQVLPVTPDTATAYAAQRATAQSQPQSVAQAYLNRPVVAMRNSNDPQTLLAKYGRAASLADYVRI